MNSQVSSLAGLSRTMAWLATIGLIVLPIEIVACFVFPGQTTDWLMFDAHHLGGDLNAGIPLVIRLGALAFELVAASFTIWALWSLRQLFFRYAKGEVFTQEALRLLNNVAVALFASVIVGFVMYAPVSLLLRLPRGAHHMAISFVFGSNDIADLFMAGVVLVIARVMAEARRIADENAKFV